jgi:hypothetical protein
MGDVFQTFLFQQEGSGKTFLASFPDRNVVGAVAYVANYGLDPAEGDKPLLQFLYLTSVLSGAFSFSGIERQLEVPAEVGASGERYPAFTYSYRPMVSKVALTCDAERAAYEHRYKQFAFARREVPFADPDRGGKRTLVMAADAVDFLKSFSQQVIAAPFSKQKWVYTWTSESLADGEVSTQTGPQVAPIDLQFNRLWPQRRQVRRRCLEHLLHGHP